MAKSKSTNKKDTKPKICKDGCLVENYKPVNYELSKDEKGVIHYKISYECSKCGKIH